MKKAIKTTSKEWGQIIFGLLIFSFGISLTIIANIGVTPWDTLGMGIANHTPFNYGISMTTISLIVLGIDLLMHESIGFGTIIDACVTGNFINFYIVHLPIAPYNLFDSICMMITGLLIAAIGQYFYMRAAQGCGPRDALLVGLGKRLSHLPVGLVQFMIYGIVLCFGYLLGGPIGIGTLISTVCSGPCMQIICILFHFDPCSIHHRSMIEIIQIIKEPLHQGT